jgi:hypothetical protein
VFTNSLCAQNQSIELHDTPLPTTNYIVPNYKIAALRPLVPNLRSLVIQYVDEGWLRETFHQGPWLTENLAVEFKDVDVKFEYSFPPPHRITKTDSHKSEDWEDEENDEAEGDGKNGEDE